MQTPSKGDNIIAGTVAAIVVIAPIITVLLWGFLPLAGISLGFLPLFIIVSVLCVLIGIVRYSEMARKLQPLPLLPMKDPRKSSKSNIIVLVGIMLTLPLIAMILWGWIPAPHWMQSASNWLYTSEGGNEGDDEGGNIYSVCACAQDRVSSMLKAPRTAKFQSGCSKTVQHVEGNNYVVTSYVDAENSFGAMLRQNYRCHVNVILNSNECNVSCEFLEE